MYGKDKKKKMMYGGTAKKKMMYGTTVTYLVEFLHLDVLPD